MISIKESYYAPWGRVLEIKDGVIQLKVTLDIGPRIIYFALKNGSNIMYEDIENSITKGGAFFEKNFEGKSWRIIGGHRLWKSPEDLESYYPDLSKVDYEIKDNTASFLSQTEKTTGICKTLSVEVLGEGKLKLCHKFTNTNKDTINVGLWALTVLRGEGKLYFFTNHRAEGFLPTQNLVFWPYSDYKDSRLEIFKDYITVSQNKRSNNAFKIGAYLQKGIAAYNYKDNLFIKKFSPCGSLFDYPDMGCNFEVYTNNQMLECESLSKILAIRPNQSAVYVEEWELVNCKSFDVLSYLENIFT